jgi:hypothetical protein
MLPTKFSNELPTKPGWYWRKYKQTSDVLWVECPEKLISNEDLKKCFYDEVLKKHGIQLSNKGGRYTSSNCVYKIEASFIGENGVVETSERKDFKVLANTYGLKPEWLDKSFKQGGNTHTIVGLARSRSKNPVMCINESSKKTFIFPTETVSAFMSIQDKTNVTA